MLDEQVALGDVLAGPADVLAELGGAGDPHLRDAAVGPLVGHHACRRPPGIGAPVMILTAVPGDIASSWACPAPISPTTGRCTGDSSVALTTSRVAHGVPVHRGVVERRQRHRRDDVLGGGEAERLHQRLREVRQRLDGGEDAREVVVDRGQVVSSCGPLAGVSVARQHRAGVDALGGGRLAG